MATENRFIPDDIQGIASPPSDAYEVYWSATENETPGGLLGGPHAAFDPVQFCDPGDAYNQLWQMWDAR
jgi:hypothetical protein